MAESNISEQEVQPFSERLTYIDPCYTAADSWEQ